MDENNEQKKEGYGKMAGWKWFLIYLLVAGIAYGAVYYFFFSNNGSYNTMDYFRNMMGYSNKTPQNKNQAQNNNVLDLSNQGLTSIPAYVFNQTNLQWLNVSGNNLTGSIQSQIGQLKNLVLLNVSHNKMTGVPAEVGQLQNLEVLDLSYNQLTGLPNELGNLQNLKTLILTGNNYSQQDLDVIKSRLPVGVNIIVQ
jgi:Leucine-rich repeat (LRR) protein